MYNKKIVMCGCHEAGILLINSLIEEGVKFSYFVSLTPEQGQKYKVSGYFDYSEIAKKNKIPIYYPETYSLKSEKDRRFFCDNKFDLLIQGGWQRLFPDFVLESLDVAAIGIHGSPDFLPKGRGRSPLNWSLLQGKRRFILSAFLMATGVDDGSVFVTQDFDINEFDDIKSLYYKVSIASKRMISSNLQSLIEGKIYAVPQKGIPSYFPKRNEEDGFIDWETMDVYEIYNLIRATTYPYPGAFALIDEKKTKIWKARPFDSRLTYKNSSYGQVVEKFDNNLVVNCLGGLLLIEDWSLCVE